MNRDISINDLPNEVLTNIFNYLDCLEKLSSRLVCKRWKLIIGFYLLKQKTLGIILRFNEDSANFRNIYDKIDRWQCSSPEHHSKNDDIICFKKSEFLQIIKKRPYIEFLDLRGSTLDCEIISAVHKYCKNLICLHLDSVTIRELGVWDRLVFDIMPKIKHLSIDNKYTLKDCTDPNDFHINTNMFFREAKNLTEIEINIYAGESLFSYDSLAEFGIKLRFASIDIRIENLETDKLILLDVIINLLKGNAKHLEFLRLSSNENYINTMGVFTRIAKFVKLQALNLSCKNYHRQDYHKITELTLIKSLTLDFNVGEDAEDDCDEPDEIMEILFKSKFSHTIERLRLVNGEISANIFIGISKYYHNLVNLQFKDIKFTNIQLSLQTIPFIQKLQSLHIEYSFKNYAEPHDLESLKSLHSFQIQFFPLLRDVLDKCENLEEVSIIEWPGLGLNQLEQLQMMAQQKAIDFQYKVF